MTLQVGQDRPVPDDFRCSAASRLDGEPLAGTAPTDRAFLLVEHAGSWGRDAPAVLADHVDIPYGVRAQLIRRHRDRPAASLTVFTAWREGPAFRVERTVVPDLAALAGLDLAALAEGRSPALTPHPQPLWLVCTNGRRDVCCAELGRPVTAALAERWPEQTWETTHLGGHRFAATLLALPSGLSLGRLDPESAVAGCAAIASGTVPPDRVRGRAGQPGAAQVAELHLRAGGVEPGALVATTVAGPRTEVAFEHGAALVETTPGPERRQSCVDLRTKPTVTHRVVVR